jgi:hypothetical protein
MNYQIDIPRQTFDGLCAFLQNWGEVYSQPGAMVFKGTMRSHRRHGKGSAFIHKDTGEGDANAVAIRFNTALCGLGRSSVRKNDAILDLRDLNEEEMDAMLFVTQNAVLKAQQTRAMNRVAKGIQEFMALPAMVRIALAAKD